MDVPCVNGQMKVACLEGQMDVIDALLEQGIDVNVLFVGFAPLHRVCARAEPCALSTKLDVVTKLLNHGANVDLECSVGWNALDCALFAQPFQPHVAELLLYRSKQGVNRVDDDNCNYLRMARSIKSIKFLVENGINVNHATDGKTYLDLIFEDKEDENSEDIDEKINYLRSVGAKLYSEL